MSRGADRTEPQTAALVILRPASGVAPDGSAVITAEVVGESLPSVEDVQRAQVTFRDEGFTIGPIVGAAFSIEAPAARFEEFFGVSLTSGDEGVTCSREGGEPGRDLPLDVLPEAVAEALVAVTFEPPAELDEESEESRAGLDI